MARKLRDLVDLERQEIAALRRRERRERHGWLWRKIQVWTERFEHLGSLAKAAAVLLPVLATLWTAGANAYKLVRKVIQIHAARYDVAPAELPPSTDVASTTVDRVPTPPAQSPPAQLSKP